MTTVLMIFAAMTLDFGMAYTYKRQAQTAADAAVLAGGSVYVDQKGSCGSLAGNGTLSNLARAEADLLVAANLPDGVGVGWRVFCNADDELSISYGVEYDSPLTLGRLASDSDHIDVRRDAIATFDRQVRGETGMRPWPICSNSFDLTTKKVVQIVAGVKANVGCPGLEIDGTWGRFACPGFAKGDGSDKDDKATSSLYWIRYGCPNPASPVPDQPDGSNPAALREWLVKYAECANLGKNSPSTEFCLARDTGKAQNKKMESAWQMVIDARQTLELPVVCAKPQCDPSDAVTAAPVVPIHQLAVVHFCGIRLDGWSSSNWPTSGPCRDANPDGWTASSAVPGDKNAFYLVVESVINGGDSGSIGGDANLRLIK